ncbi:MAG: hypothetical protein ACTS42_01170 [Candidatus Hodgkinia cicadicola]
MSAVAPLRTGADFRRTQWVWVRFETFWLTSSPSKRGTNEMDGRFRMLAPTSKLPIEALTLLFNLRKLKVLVF